MRRPCIPVSPCAAFTLPEVLVAMAVLTLIVVFAARIVAESSRQSSYANKRLQGNAAATTLFSILSNDVAHMVRRPDVEIDVRKNPLTLNDELFFLSQTPGVSGTVAPKDLSGISLVGYRVDAASQQLQRLARPLRWAELEQCLLPNRLGNLVNTASPEHWHGIGGFFRFEVAFSHAPGPAPDLPPQPYSYLTAGGANGYSTASLGAVKPSAALTSIRVALAYLDEDSRKICSVTQLKEWAEKFCDAYDDPSSEDHGEFVSADEGTKTTWSDQLNTLTKGPETARQAIRVHQAAFPIPTF